MPGLLVAEAGTVLKTHWWMVGGRGGTLKEVVSAGTGLLQLVFPGAVSEFPGRWSGRAEDWHWVFGDPNGLGLPAPASLLTKGAGKELLQRLGGAWPVAHP